MKLENEVKLNSVPLEVTITVSGLRLFKFRLWIFATILQVAAAVSRIKIKDIKLEGAS